MGEQDYHVSGYGDWGAPSPSPRTFFSSLLGDDMTSKQILEKNNNMLFLDNNIMGKNNDNDKTNGELTRLDMFSQQKINSHGGLLERMAARAGFNAPKLNTDGVRPSGNSENQDNRSTFLTIPPGLSPTTLLESPVFLSNALAEPSPTTGKFPFSFGGINNRNFSLATEGLDKSQENFYGLTNASSFVFKTVPESGHSSFLGPTNNNFPGFEVSRAENSSPPDDQQDEEAHQPSSGDQLPGGAPAEDGYNWRKYGQKQVKGSEYPRSYYKCTHPNCTVKKKVERSHEGHITEIIYKGTHIHPKPPADRRSGADLLLDTQADVVDHRLDCLEVTSSASFGVQNDDNGEDDDRATHGSASLGYDEEEDESESKRRKIEEAYAADICGATRAIREPRVVVQTTSEVDILDDGYRWRKYGQKVVKGNPNPRSYYKCTHAGCNVRKHVERASHDLKSVITTYEGKHNHEVPVARNNSHQASANGPARNQRSDLAQSHNDTDRFGGNQFGPGLGYGFGMGQPSLAKLAMAGLGPDRNGLSIMPPHQYMGQQSRFDGMGFMLPKGEPKVEPLTDMNFSNGYYQMMSRLPLGP